MISITKEEIVRRLREMADGIERGELSVGEYSQTVTAGGRYDKYETIIQLDKRKDYYL